MREIITDIIIDAPKEKIWALLTDFDNYSNWNSFITKAKGTPSSGRTVKIKVRANNVTLPTITAKIRIAEENKELSWGGPDNALASKIVGADHYFQIEELSDNQCRFIHGERFYGILPMLTWKVIAASKPGYLAMNQEIKEQAEMA
ncbi:MAG: SRPBCC domain-containing protein [Pseudomonadales bacterium]|nr:SRPBCC domain-containing protein [Pseudomonadales bacterium]